ncbi:hypothetical protein [Hydrogenimonas urashimensis]|uniref:hypothetical protein n=1 Tax=Hydrogenimonas urashimensis TaxID=2740515 RepID=UPI001915156B|nr:hypothetical protein [Hydrogenimonas urashimensis]
MKEKERRFALTLLLAILFCIPAALYGYEGVAFKRVYEPRERAFSILVPKGWQHEGGIFRVNALQAGGPLNAMEAKCDLLYKSDKKATVAFHIYPDIVYAHLGIGGGFFPPGSNYQGAEVKQIMDAKTFLKALFAYYHPRAANVRILKLRPLPGEKLAIDRGLAYMNRLLASAGMPQATFTSDAAGGVFEYTEGGTRFREIMMTGIVDMRGAMTWKNTRTLSFRAPVKSFDRWKPVMDIMRFSIRFNPDWILKEAHGQKERARIVMKIYDRIRQIDQEILRKTRINKEEIMNDNFLVLTGQEEYVNPHTGEVELDTDAFRHRWKTPQGDVYYTNQEDEDPNTFLHQTGYKRTKIRKRRNE